VIEAMQLQW